MKPGGKKCILRSRCAGRTEISLAHVVGGRGTGPWVFTTFEVDFEKQHKKIDLISGRVVDYDPTAYVEVHIQLSSVTMMGNARESVGLAAIRNRFFE
jgi:hypothetical protein